jgi:RNA polymerase sigma-70 factor (ECF subfamily)
MPDEAEPAGLVALMTLHHARRAARAGADGALVLLDDQDRARWDRDAIARGIAGVERALRMARPPGRFALQAAIAAVHAEAPTAAATDWPQILALYDELMRRWPSPVVALNRSVAVAQVHGPEAGLEIVEALAGGGTLGAYAPLYATRADLLRRLGRGDEAAAEYAVAARLTDNPAERAFLGGRAGGAT